jgi:DNA-binding MarR family transcriptional regulator
VLKKRFNARSVGLRLVPILKMLEAGNYPAKIARLLGMSKPHVSYYIRKMRRAGLVRRRNVKWPAFYVVTEKGKKFLTRCKLLEPGFLFRLHRCGFKYPILKNAAVPVDWRRVPKACGHWTALIGDEGGVKVEKTTRHVIVWCESISGRDPDELLLRAKSLADRVAASLVAKYGFQLGEGRLVPKKHIGVYDPAAELLSRRFEISDDVGKIDRSEGLGEIDWFSAKAAKDYLLMPSRVESLEQQVAGLQGQIQELVQVLKEAFAPKENHASPLKDGRYIT